MSDITRDYSFGGWLRHFRIRSRLSLREIGKRLDMDAANYCKLERSEAVPPKNRAAIEKLMKVLDAEDSTDLMVSLAFQDHLATLRQRFK